MEVNCKDKESEDVKLESKDANCGEVGVKKFLWDDL